MRILFDESHNQTWTIDPNAAVFLASTRNESPEYYSYHHVAVFLQNGIGATVSRNATPPLNPGKLDGVQVLVINHFVGPDNRHPAMGGEGAYSPDEIDCIVAAVTRGMGLFILGEYDIDR